MTRRLLGIVALAIAAAGAAGAATSARQIPLAVPPAQSVAIEAVKLAGTDTAATLRLSGAGSRQATALVASKANTLFVVVVNRAGGRASIRLSAPGSTAVTVKSLPDVTSVSPRVRATFPGSVGKFLGWNPFANPDAIAAPGVVVRVYDSAHPSGQAVTPQVAVRSADDAAQLLISPNISVRDDLYKQIDETSACILGRLTCGKYVFSFMGLEETIVRSDDPKFKLTTHYIGTTCGRTMLGQPWKITTRSGSGGPVKHTVDLRKRNDVFTTVAKVKGVGSGTAIHKLGPQPGAFPGMQALVDSTGVWSSDAGGVTVAVKVTRLPAGKAC